MAHRDHIARDLSALALRLRAFPALSPYAAWLNRSQNTARSDSRISVLSLSGRLR